MTRLQDIPISKLVLPFVAGLLLPSPISENGLWILCVVLLGALGIWERLARPPRRREYQLRSLLFLSAGLLMGWLHALPKKAKDTQIVSGTHWVELLRLDRVEPDRVRGTFQLGSTTAGGSRVLRLSGNLISAGMQVPAIGSRLLIRTELEPITGPRYPGDFDARSYNHALGITHRFLATHWVVLPSKPDPAQRLRNTGTRWAQTFLTYFEAKRAGILAALILGDRSRLDPAVREQFIRSGTIHVLAVSGLHVGALFSLLNGLGRVLGWSRKALWSVLVLSVLWGYGFLSGAGWPVLRACLMFSIMQWSRLRSGRHNALNALLLSAWISLLLEPMAIYQLSFQFSYLALLGILIWYSRLTKLLPDGGAVGKPILDLILLGVCAQYFLFPLAVHSFGQFPLHFLLGNLFVVPYMVLLFYSGSMLLFLGMCGVVWPPIVWGMDHLLAYCIKMSNHLASWEGALLQGIHWDNWDLLLVYLGLVLLLFLRTRLAIVTLLLGLGLWLVPSGSCERRIILYKGGGATHLLLTEGNKAWVLSTGFSDPCGPDGEKARRIAAFFGANEVHWIPRELLQRESLVYDLKTGTEGEFRFAGVALQLGGVGHATERPGNQAIIRIQEHVFELRGSARGGGSDWRNGKGAQGMVLRIDQRAFEQP